MADFENYYDIGKAEMLLRRPDLFVNEGDVSDFVVAMAAAMADKNDQHANDLSARTFVDTAEGDDLTTLADDHWSIQRQEAVKSTVALSLARATDAAGAGTISAGAIVATDRDINGDDVRFVLDADVNFGATDLTAAGLATAEVAGVAGNVEAGTLTNIIDSIWDPTVTVTNAAPSAGGTEAESDPALRERIREYPSTLRRGTLDALRYGAKSVAGVETATASEDPITALVTVYVADGSGNSTAQMVADVEAELENWRAAGCLVTVEGGSVVYQNVVLSITAKAGTDTGALVADIEAAVRARMNKLSIGETLYRTMIRTAAMNVRIDKIDEVTVTTPATDVAPASNEIIRPGTIAVS